MAAFGLVVYALLVASDAATGEETSIDPGVWVRHPLRGFEVMAGEVTVGQFRACVDEGACDATVASSRCNFGKDDRDAHPINCITFTGAEQVCAWLGGRLCTEEEWLAVCRGTDDRAYPYGDRYSSELCNVESNAGGSAPSANDTLPVGSSPGCEGGLAGVFDLAGNVAEWIDACQGSYCKFRGAGYLSNEPVDLFTSCGGVCAGNQKTLQSNVVGVRCCRDAPTE